MGSHHFEDCTTEERFTFSWRRPRFKGYMWLVRDWDQRRSINVYAPDRKYDEDFVFDALVKFIDDIDPNTVLVRLSDDGELESSSLDPFDDSSEVPLYPLRTAFPPDIATVRRCDLTEVDRLGFCVDLVTYQPRPGETRQAVFKYYTFEGNLVIFWHEANCVMRMPRHPNIVPFDALVVESLDGVDRVVGFTTHYVPGLTLSENKDRVFKLKYLEELIDVSTSTLSCAWASHTKLRHAAYLQ